MSPETPSLEAHPLTDSLRFQLASHLAVQLELDVEDEGRSDDKLRRGETCGPSLFSTNSAAPEPQLDLGMLFTHSAFHTFRF
jgi:hypothetical protein